MTAAPAGMSLCAAALLLAASSAMAEPPADCRTAIAAAAQAHGVPAAILLAIGQVESGLMPWTINAAGVPHGFASREAAIAATRLLLVQGVQSIDTGCLQVNLAWHPQAFASLAEAFDPPANANYAARLLAGLYRQTGDWTAAAARYHSAERVEGARYADAVAAALDGDRRLAGAPAAGQRPAAPSLAAVYGSRLLVQSGLRLTPARLDPFASPMIVP